MCETGSETVESGIAHGADFTIQTRIPRIDDRAGQHYLTQSVVRFNLDVLDDSTTAQTGSIHVTLFLKRKEAVLIPIDEGFISMCQFGENAVVGHVGQIGCDEGDLLIVKGANFSGATVSVRLEYAMDFVPVGDQAECEGFRRLSTKHSAIWAYRNIFTQSAAGGGAVVFDLAPSSEGEPFEVLSATLQNSGTNTAQVTLIDEDNNEHVRLVSVGSAATTQGAFPQNVSNAATSGVLATSNSSGIGYIDGNDKFTLRQTGAGAQNDTMTVSVRARVWGRPPTRSIARSTNPADVDGIGVADGTEGTPTINRVF